MKRPSERIAELADETAAHRAATYAEQLKTRPEIEQKQLEQDPAQLTSYYRRQPETMCIAVAAYLDEAAGFPITTTGEIPT